MSKAIIIVAFVVVAAVPAVAEASDRSVARTLHRAGPTIQRDETLVRSGLQRYPAGWVRLARSLEREARDLRALRSVVLGESGPSNVVRGLALIATAYSALGRDVLAAHGGLVPRARVQAAVRADKRGRALLARGVAHAAHAAAWRLS